MVNVPARLDCISSRSRTPSPETTACLKNLEHNDTTELPEGSCLAAIEAALEELKNYETSTDPELEKKYNEIWRDYEPDEDSNSSDYELPPPSLTQLRKEQEEKDRERIQLMTSPSEQHQEVPEWVYFSRNYKKLFKKVLAFYLKKMRWPDYWELPLWFRRKSEFHEISSDSVRRTSGFAPVWIFLLKELVDAKTVELEVLEKSIEKFFEEGTFPDIEDLPPEVDAFCRKLQVGPNHFYETFQVL